MELVIKYISERLFYLLTEMNSKIAIVGFVGSLSPKTDSGDIDIFSFLSDSDKIGESYLQRHKELISSIKIIQNELKEKKINLSVFTEFRLEEFSRFNSKQDNKYKDVLLHLKVYPTPSSVLEWQQKAITFSYFSNISRVIYRTTSEASLFEYLKKNIPQPNLNEKVDFLRMLIYEMAEYIELGNLPKDLKNLELKNKLTYVSDYLINYLFEYEEIRLKETSIADKRKILSFRKKITELKSKVNTSNIDDNAVLLDQYFNIIEEIYFEIS